MSGPEPGRGGPLAIADLFAAIPAPPVEIRPGMLLLPGFADAAALLPLVREVAARAPFRHMTHRWGQRLSVAMTNCGTLGWVSDRRGYRYSATDPDSGAPWPPLPAVFASLATRAAAAAGFVGFTADACLINRYAPGARLTAHQDVDERDFAHPIVSVSLGLPATFVVGLGGTKGGPTRAVPLASGDVVVWGGPARLALHSVRRLKPGTHPLTGDCRINLTLRRAG